MYYTLEITKRVDLICSQQKKKWQLCDMMEVLANTLVVIVLQYVSNQYFVYLQLTIDKARKKHVNRKLDINRCIVAMEKKLNF